MVSTLPRNEHERVGLIKPEFCCSGGEIGVVSRLFASNFVCVETLSRCYCAQFSSRPPAIAGGSIVSGFGVGAAGALACGLM